MKQQEKTEKTLISFGCGFLEKVDQMRKLQHFKNRSEYINYLVRKDMENHGPIQPTPLERTPDQV